MAPVTTYVFLDLETTSLPALDLNKTRITEISLIAIKREHLLDTRSGALPRVQHKLTLCINPCRMIAPEGTEITKLCNDLLEFESPFKMETFNTINSFLGLLAKPVCLIAYNGLYFDYPILKAQVDKLNVSFFDDLLCADAYHSFYFILEQRNRGILNNNVSVDNSLTDAIVQTRDDQNVPESLIEDLTNTSTEDKTLMYSSVDFTSMQAVNETTPKKKVPISTPHTPKKGKKALKFPKFPWGDKQKPNDSYKLKNVYERVLKREAIEAHRAENDCILLMEIAVALSKDFVEWVDSNHIAFADVNPMRPGVEIGY